MWLLFGSWGNVLLHLTDCAYVGEGSGVGAGASAGVTWCVWSGESVCAGLRVRVHVWVWEQVLAWTWVRARARWVWAGLRSLPYHCPGA
jgi:hypothetical protein